LRKHYRKLLHSCRDLTKYEILFSCSKTSGIVHTKKVYELQKVTAYPIESSRKGGAKPKKIDVRRDRTLGGEKRGSTIATPAKYNAC